MTLLDQTTQLWKLRLSPRTDAFACYGTVAAEKIREIPGILDVQVRPERQEIVVRLQDPVEEVLLDVFRALKSCGCRVATGEIR